MQTGEKMNLLCRLFGHKTNAHHVYHDHALISTTTVCDRCRTSNPPIQNIICDVFGHDIARPSIYVFTDKKFCNRCSETFNSCKDCDKACKESLCNNCSNARRSF